MEIKQRCVFVLCSLYSIRKCSFYLTGNTVRVVTRTSQWRLCSLWCERWDGETGWVRHRRWDSETETVRQRQWDGKRDSERQRQWARETVRVRWWDRETETVSQRDSEAVRERDNEMVRQRDSETETVRRWDRETVRQRKSETDGETKTVSRRDGERETVRRWDRDRQWARETVRRWERERETERQWDRDSEAVRQRDSETEKKRDRGKVRQRETDGECDTHTVLGTVACADTSFEARLHHLGVKDEAKIVSVHAMKACMGSRGVAPLMLKLCTKWRRIFGFTPLPPYSPWSLNNRLGWHQRRSGRSWEDRNLCSGQETKPGQPRPWPSRTDWSISAPTLSGRRMINVNPFISSDYFI